MMAVDPKSPTIRFRLNQFIGWEMQRGGAYGAESLCIGMLPGRKRFALYREVTGAYLPLAYFASYEDAIEAVRLIGALVSGTYVPGEVSE